MKKRILIVAYFYYPSSAVGARRIYNLKNFLIKNDFEPTVLTVKSLYYPSVDPALTDDSNVIRTNTDQLIVRDRSKNEGLIAGFDRRIKGQLNIISRKFLFPDTFIGWKRHALKAAQEAHEKKPFDCIIASGQPWTCFLIGYEASLAHGIPLIMDYRDPWTLNRNHGTNRVLRFLSARFEKKMLAHAYHVIVNTEKVRDQFIQIFSGLVASKISVVRNGYDEALADTVRSTASGVNEDKFSITHTGLFYLSRRLEPFIRAVSDLLSENPTIRNRIQVVCYGFLLPDDRNLVRQLKLEDVIVEKQFIPYIDSLKELAKSSMSLLVVGDDHASMIPAKLFDYFMVGRPIFCIGPKDSEAGVLIRRHDFGICAEADAAAIKKALKESYKKYEEGKLRSIDAPVEYSVGRQFLPLVGILGGGLKTKTDPRKLRILHVIHTLNLGGAESNLYNLVSAGDPSQVEPHVAYASGGAFEEKFRKKGTHLLKYALKSTNVKSLGSLAIVLKLAFYIRRNRIQVVHTHNYNAHVWGSLAAKLAGAKIVEHVHDPRYEPAAMFESRGLEATRQFRQAGIFARLSDRILVVTENNRNFVLKKGWKGPAGVHLLPNGIPLENGEAVSGQLPEKPSGKSVVFTAMRLSLEKNAGLIPAIAKKVPGEDVVFWIAGDGPDKEKIEREIAAEGLGFRVKLLGYRSDVRALLGQADIFILPTLRELHSLTMLEAMSCGVPALVSKGAGCNDQFISHGQNGFLLDPLNADEWAAAIRRLLDDRALAQRIGQAGRELIERGYDIRGTSKKIEAIYRELVEK